MQDARAAQRRRRRRRRLRAMDLTMHQWIRLFSLASVLLMAALTAVTVLAVRHYNEYPISVDRSSIRVVERGSEHITIAWEETHNSEVYKVFVKAQEEVDGSPDTEPAQKPPLTEPGGDAEPADPADSSQSDAGSDAENSAGSQSDADSDAENSAGSQSDADSDAENSVGNDTEEQKTPANGEAAASGSEEVSAAENMAASDAKAGDAEPTEPSGDEERPGKRIEIDETWRELETSEGEILVEDLEEDTAYYFAVRGDSAEHEGIVTEPCSFRTKKSQNIELGRRHITKLTSNKPFKLDAEAETGLVYESSDPSVAEVLEETGEIQLNGPGTAEITIRAVETTEYDTDKETVEIEVIKAEPVNASGASARIIYHLDSDNCDVVKRITGSGGAVVPQGLGYSGDKYIVSYGMGSPNRIISFDVDGDGKDVSVPKAALGHPNGFAYADENGLCYCVKGWSSKAVTYEPSTGKYGSVSLKYGCSGIGYDRKEKLLYTCSRTAMVAYDIADGYKVKYRTGVVKHSGYTYTQDCGGGGGILLRCLSGSSKHGTNYIDLYDMKNGKYLGTISCDLSEVESCIVDKDGYLEILSNNSGSTDYIWRTNINIETIGEGL